MNAREIIRAVADYHGTTVDRIMFGGRPKSLAAARHDAMWLLRIIAGMSYPETARAVGLRNHTSAMHGVEMAVQRNASSPGRGEALLALVTT